MRVEWHQVRRTPPGAEADLQALNHLLHVVQLDLIGLVREVDRDPAELVAWHAQQLGSGEG